MNPAFQFYPDDFLGGVADMTQSEVGAYILLLCQQWNRGSIPVQPDRQKLLAKGDVSDHVLAKFRENEDGILRNERLEKERKKQAQFSASQRLKGQKSGEARRTPVEPRLNDGSAPVATEGQPKGNSPISDLRTAVSTERGTRASSDVPSWKEFWSYCQMVGMAAEWYAKDKFLAAEADNWDKKGNWQAYASRIRAWWEDAGRPMHPRAASTNAADGTPRKRPPRSHVDAEWNEAEWKWV